MSLTGLAFPVVLGVAALVLFVLAVRGGSQRRGLVPGLRRAADLDPTQLLTGDGNHPNAAGHERLAQAALVALGFPAD